MNAIFKRRSVREYLDKEVEDDKINDILRAGMCAPSAGNQQPWHFIVVRDKAKLEELSALSPYSKMLAGASAGIVICGDKTKEKHENYWMLDCSAATENMLIEISYLELGGVWLGVYPREDRIKFLTDYFKLPENVIPFAMLAVGYPKSEVALADRYKEERVHYDTW